MTNAKKPDVELHFDDDAYGEVVPGFIFKVVRNIIHNLSRHGIIDLDSDLSEDAESLVFSLATGVFVQFEDFKGHQHNDRLYPAAVGFTINTLDKKPAHDPERLLSTQKRTFLHGGVENDIIRTAFEELRTS